MTPQPPPRPRDLARHLVRFSGALREAGIAATPGDQIDAATALRHIDVGDREEFRLALRAALKIEHRAWPLFDHLFERWWNPAAARTPPRSRPAPPAPKVPRRWPGHANPLAELARTIAERGHVGPPDPAAPDRGRPGYSPRALLRRKSFESCTPDELREMERLLERLARRLATRRSRRLVPSPRGPVIDLRRSLRRSPAQGGELIELARRTRLREVPSLVFLCDTSGSMDPWARLLLAFVLALGKVAGRTEVFAFNTALTRLTPWIRAGSAVGALGRFAREVEDWSGGTRIGDCLAAFVDDHLRETVRADTSVLVFSDGLDRGDTGALAASLLQIRRRARRLIWLNPLMGDPRYRPEARGMMAALPHLDHLVPAHSLEALENLLPLLGRASAARPAAGPPVPSQGSAGSFPNH